MRKMIFLVICLLLFFLSNQVYPKGNYRLAFGHSFNPGVFSPVSDIPSFTKNSLTPSFNFGRESNPEFPGLNFDFNLLREYDALSVSCNLNIENLKFPLTEV